MRAHRPSIIVHILGACIAVATVAAVASSVDSVLSKANTTNLWEFGELDCPVPEEEVTNVTTVASAGTGNATTAAWSVWT